MVGSIPRRNGQVLGTGQTLLKKITGVMAMAAIMAGSAGLAEATPSSQIVIPSPDSQPFATVHLGIDVRTTLFTSAEDGGRDYPTGFGATVGLVETPFFDVEVGVDLREQSDEPWYFNAKLTIKEGVFHEFSPAFAIGMYDAGLDQDLAGYNISYALIAKTFPIFGRITLGYYYGSDLLLLDDAGEPSHHGILASWDRTLAEVDDRLWLAVDYMGGGNIYGALSFGVAWRFSPNISVLAGYTVFNDIDVAGENVYTIQVDIDL